MKITFLNKPLSLIKTYKSQNKSGFGNPSFTSNLNKQDCFSTQTTKSNINFACKIIQNYLNKGKITFADIKECFGGDIDVIQSNNQNNIIAAISQNGFYFTEKNLVYDYKPDNYTLFMSDIKDNDIDETIHVLVHEYTHYLQMKNNIGLSVDDIINSLKAKKLNNPSVVNSIIEQTNKKYSILEGELKTKLIADEMNMSYKDVIHSTKPLKKQPIEVLFHAFEAKNKDELTKILKKHINTCINESTKGVLEKNPYLKNEEEFIGSIIKKQIDRTIKIEFEANKEAFLITKEINNVQYPCASDVVVLLFREMLKASDENI